MVTHRCSLAVALQRPEQHPNRQGLSRVEIVPGQTDGPDLRGGDDGLATAFGHGLRKMFYVTRFLTFANGLRLNQDPKSASSCLFPVMMSLPSSLARAIAVYPIQISVMVRRSVDR